MPRSHPEIIAALQRHLADEDGTLNDSTTDALYREWHRLSAADETDLESVEAWAVDAFYRPPITDPEPCNQVA